MRAAGKGPNALGRMSPGICTYISTPQTSRTLGRGHPRTGCVPLWEEQKGEIQIMGRATFEGGFLLPLSCFSGGKKEFPQKSSLNVHTYNSKLRTCPRNILVQLFMVKKSNSTCLFLAILKKEKRGEKKALRAKLSQIHSYLRIPKI